MQTETPNPTLSERIAAASALSVVLPAAFLARDVHLCITRQDCGGWKLGAVDGVGRRYPILIGGVEDDTTYLSRRQAFEAMEAKGHQIGARYTARPAVH